MAKRKICVITGTRAEYGLLKPVMEKIRSTEGLQLQIVATGMHLLESFGNTWKDIEAGGFKIDRKVPMYQEPDLAEPRSLVPPHYSIDEVSHADALCKGIRGIAKAYSKLSPDVVLLLGDRLEPLAGALAALGKRIAVAHIHGGDKSSGAHIDEQIRHTITKLAHIHFPATELSAKRIAALNEEKWRITMTGSPAIDNLRRFRAVPREEICAQYGLPHGLSFLVFIYHPIERLYGIEDDFALRMLSCIEKLNLHALVIYPNNDRGSTGIIRQIEEFRGRKLFSIHKNLPHGDFLSMLKHCSAIVGNSTAGIIEASYLKTPAVNVGPRNEFREHGLNALNMKDDIFAFEKNLKKAVYDKKFRQAVRRSKSPYGNGHASEKIVKVLRDIRLDDKLFHKQIK